MGSSGQPDRSLSGGISLPQWMRNKIDARFDFDDSTFSPPSYDDSFFYVRYPKAQDTAAKTSEAGFRPISEVLNETKTMTASNHVVSSQPIPPDFKVVKDVDFSKHPLPCQPFVPNASQKAAESKPPRSAYVGKVKSQGVDDGFHGEPAMCGRSIVHVANQIMSGKVTRGFLTESDRLDTSAEANPQPRKCSKSLPASPLASPMSTPDSSPKTRRKAIKSNRYFTGAFLPDKEKYQSGWILASILGQQRDTASMSNRIEEEDESDEVVAVAPKTLSRKKSISTQNLTYVCKEEADNALTTTTTTQQTTNKNVYTNVFQAKPSELREMNFWSPTSM